MYLPKTALFFIKKISIFLLFLSIFFFFLIYSLYPLKFAIVYLLILTLVVLLVLFFTFPVFNFPEPTGYFFIGSKSYHLKDQKRKDPHTNFIENRELVVNVWYPSDKFNKDKRNFYLKEIVGNKKIINNFFQVPIHTFSEVDISNHYDNYPVILISHGLGGLSDLYLAQIQELVSNGYVVVGINHSYSCFLTFLPDGRILPNNYDISIERALNGANGNVINKITNEIDICIEDIRFTIDMLESFNIDSNSFLKSRLNLNNLAIMGHSVGGAISAEICRLEKRCKAGVSLDGSIIERTVESGFNKPFLFLVGYLLDKEQDILNRRLRRLKINNEHFKTIKKQREHIATLCDKIGKDAFYIPLKEAGHLSFTDLSHLSPVLKTFLNVHTGAKHGPEITKKTNKYLISFFDKFLKQRENPYFEEFLKNNNIK